MKFITATLLLVACAQARLLPSHPMLRMVDFQEGMDTRVTNGLDADEGMFPWQAALRIPIGTNKIRVCGGTLISDSWVLTAAHCTDGATTIEVQLGGVNLSSGMEYIETTTQIIAHVNYDGAKLLNDIALIGLPKPVKFSDNIDSILLPYHDYPDMSGRAAIISGFGQTTAGTHSSRLQYIDLLTVTNEECQETYGSYIVDSHICAEGYRGGDICMGDSGGPLVYYSPTPTLIGVINFVHNDGCGLGHPSGFARVTSYLDWIKKYTGIKAI